MGFVKKYAFSISPIPEIPDDFENKSGMDRVLKKTLGSGRVSGTRWALVPVVAVGVSPFFLPKFYLLHRLFLTIFLCRLLILTSWRWLLEGQRDKERLKSQPRTKEETATLGKEETATLGKEETKKEETATLSNKVEKATSVEGH